MAQFWDKRFCCRILLELSWDCIVQCTAAVSIQYTHNGCLWEFLSKMYLRQISFLGTNENKIWKNNSTLVMSILKVDKLIMPLFFLISYSLVPKIEICLKYFMDKNSKKQPLCTVGAPYQKNAVAATANSVFSAAHILAETPLPFSAPPSHSWKLRECYQMWPEKANF